MPAINSCCLTSAELMSGRDWQAQQNLFFQQIQHIQMRIRQDAVELFFLIVQRIQAGLVAQQQP